MRYFIAVHNGDIYKVEGTPVVIKGFEEFSFIIHKAVGLVDKYRVSEVLTGRGVGKARLSEKAAINSAKKFLSTKSLKDIRDRIKQMKLKEVEGAMP